MRFYLRTLAEWTIRRASDGDTGWPFTLSIFLIKRQNDERNFRRCFTRLSMEQWFVSCYIQFFIYTFVIVIYNTRNVFFIMILKWVKWKVQYQIGQSFRSVCLLNLKIKKKISVNRVKVIPHSSVFAEKIITVIETTMQLVHLYAVIYLSTLPLSAIIYKNPTDIIMKRAHFRDQPVWQMGFSSLH